MQLKHRPVDKELECLMVNASVLGLFFTVSHYFSIFSFKASSASRHLRENLDVPESVTSLSHKAKLKTECIYFLVQLLIHTLKQSSPLFVDFRTFEDRLSTFCMPAALL